MRGVCVRACVHFDLPGDRNQLSDQIEVSIEILITYVKS